MARNEQITVTRANESDELTFNRFGAPVSATVPFTVAGTDDEKAAIDAALAFAKKEIESNTSRYRGLYRNGTDAIEMLAPLTWRVKILYGIRHSSLSSTDSDGDSSVTYESASESVTVLVPFNTTSSAGSQSHPGVINPDENGNARGIQVESSYLVLTETRKFSNSKFSSSYRHLLYELVDHMNDKTFRGYYAGEVLFSHFSAKQQGDSRGDWSVTFTFKIRPNKRNVKCGKDADGHNVVVPRKFGWDVIWVTVKEVVKNGTICRCTVGAYSDQVFEFADFGKLKIGTR